MTGLEHAIELVRAGDLAHVEAIRQQVLELCAANPDSLTPRANEVAHLTASALVVDPATARFVVLHHRKLGKWLQPGGHADGDGDLAAGALREATEETGLESLTVDPVAVDIDVHEVRPPGEPPHLHLDVRFLVLAAPGASADPPPGNEESHEVRWVSAADLDGLNADESVRRLVDRGLRRFRRLRP